MASFIEERLLDCVSYGFQGGPTFYTQKVPMRSGVVRRDALRSRPKYRFSAPYNNLGLDNHADVIRAFNACQGSATGFRFKDWSDYQAVGEPIATIVSHSITASTISAAASDNSFNDSGAGFVAAGFVVGDRLKGTVTGNTTYTYTVLTVTTTKMVVDKPVVTQIAGGSFTLSTLTAAVQLQKTYTLGSQSTLRPIVKPVSGTVTVYADGTPHAGTIDTTTGLFLPTAPWSGGDVITADFEFDVPVMFASDDLIFDYNNFQALTANIELEEDFSA